MVVGIDSNKAAKVASDLLGKAANEFVTSATGSISGSVDSLNSTLATVKDLAKGVSTEPSTIDSFFKPLQDLLKFGGDLIKSGSSYALSSILSLFGLAPPAPAASSAPTPAPAAPAPSPAPAPTPAPGRTPAVPPVVRIRAEGR